MSLFNKMTRVILSPLLSLLLAIPWAGILEARSRKGEKFLSDGQKAESAKQWDTALSLYEQAVAEDPSDSAYLLAIRRIRVVTGMAKIDEGQKIREQGKLEEALQLFIRAAAIDPSSSMADQEIRRTRLMIDREKKRTTPVPDEERGLTPTQQARKETEERVGNIQGAPELKPISRQITSLKMNNQPVKVLFETVGKLSGINVIFDSEYQTSNRNFSVDLTNTTLEEALDHVSVLTKSYWKPLSPNTIFVTNDNVTKRRDFEDHIVKVFYLQNVTSVQELQEIATAVRSVMEIRRLFTYNAQNVIIARGSVDQVALAEKLLQDLDKPKSEVVVDVIVMEANRDRTRDLYAAIATGGNPGIRTTIAPTFGSSTSSTSTGTGSATTTTSTTSTGSTTLAGIGNVWRTGNFSVSVPSALLSAVMKDSSTRVRQSPQVRAADGMKTSLRIGDRVPTASGSFQPGVGGIGVSPLVNTQFQFIEVGVNVDIVPRVHGTDEVTMHVELEVSTVRDHVDIGGIQQPVIGQRKINHDVRLREGEVNLVGGLIQEQDSKTVSGIPGLAQIPFFRRFFSSEGVEKQRSELLIALVPHIVRSPEINANNLRGILAGNDQTVKLNMTRRDDPAGGTKPAPSTLGPISSIEGPAPAPGPKADVPVSTTKLSFEPDGVVTRPGSNIILTLKADGAVDLFSAPVKLKYDPKMLKLVSASAGVLLTGGNQKVNLNENTQNDKGEATITLNRLPGSPGVSGSGALLSLTFQALASGTANISVTEAAFKNSQLQSIAAKAPPVSVEIR